MGIKYVPTIKDQKANQRYQQKINPLPKTKKTPSAKGGKKR